MAFDLDDEELKATRAKNLKLSNPKHIVICGSSKQTSTIKRLQLLLQRLNYKVDIPEEFIKDITKLEATKLHLDKIKQKDTDLILIVNGNGNEDSNYIGPNTFVEIACAIYNNKPVYLLNDIYSLYKNELEGWNVKVLKGDISILLKE